MLLTGRHILNIWGGTSDWALNIRMYGGSGLLWRGVVLRKRRDCCRYVRGYGNMGIWEYGNSLKMGCVVRLEGYLSVMLLPCSITTGALGSPGLLLSYSIITISLNIIIILTMRCLHVFLHLYIYISTMRSVHHRVLKTPSSRI